MLKAEPRVEQMLQDALRHHQTGNLSEAEALYQQVLQLDPANSDAMHLLGALAAQMQHREVAVDWIRRAVAIQPRFPIAYSNLGRILLDMGCAEEAIAACRQAGS